MGDTILGNRYQIIRKIGDGGMAFVYEAKDKLLNRTVAVKVLRPEFVDDEEFLKKFKREAEAVASLSHPNIVNVYDVGEDGKVNYIVMEYIDGQNLKDIIKNEGTLDEYTALDITKQIAMALSAAHKKGIVHRDIKPHNILISNEGRIVKVADFGIAKAVTNSTMTNVGNIIGSVHYFSPEQAKGNSVNSTADLYSLGIVLYEMIIGRVPFVGDSPISIALQHINDDLEFTSDEKVNIPQSVRTIIKKLTEKSSENRYQSAEELIEDIDYVEKNIDLDFIKEYDNFATKQVDFKKIELNNDDLDTEELIEEENSYATLNKQDKPRRNKEKKVVKEDSPKTKKKKKVVKEDSPKTKKKLKIILVILLVILAIQIFAIGKFALGFLSGTNSIEQTVEVPNLTNENLETVNKQLENLGLIVIVKSGYSDTVEKDHVISQSPNPGTQVSHGDTVTVILSNGPKQNTAPNIVGETLSQAESELIQNNSTIGNIKYEYSDRYKEGIVISQSTSGTKVNVVVSKGQEVKEENNTIIQTPSNNNTNNNSNNNINNNTNNNVNNNTNNNVNNNSTNNNTQNNNNNSTDNGTNDNTSDGTTNTTPEEDNNNSSEDTGSDDVINDSEGGTTLPQ